MQYNRIVLNEPHVEINKRVYMEEDSLRLKCPSHFKQSVNSIITNLLQYYLSP